jgi:hypothetical protein
MDRGSDYDFLELLNGALSAVTPSALQQTAKKAS